MLEELHKAEQARDLLTDLERRLAGVNSGLGGPADATRAVGANTV
jgi:hypothetical protein